ncbi:unnamed protein product [Effrenium voratum]|nr:unnamed protein product [Effrenium voratum]
MDASSTAWLVEGAEVERELDDIGNIWIGGRITRVKDGRQLVDLEYLDGSAELGVPLSDVRPLLPMFTPPVRQSPSAPAPPAPADPPPPAPPTAPSAPSRTVSLRERIAQLREETGTLDKNVQNLRERQDSGLAALQFANESVAEARSGLNQSMLSAEGCLSEIQDLVREAKMILGEVACSAGFRDLAVLERLRGPNSSEAGHQVEGHELIQAWMPTPGSGGRCAISSTLRLSGYPWPNVLETVVVWVHHHRSLGFAPIILFLDEPDPDKANALQSALAGVDVVHVLREAEMRAAWRDHGALFEEFGNQTTTELSAKQILNTATAARLCGDVPWLLCNLDLDEAMFFTGGGVAQHFGDVPANTSQIVYINHEAIVPENPGRTWFEQMGHFKLSPITKLPFISRKFPAIDEEPQILEHPDGTGDATLRFWQGHNSRLSEQYNFKKRSSGGTCSYFDGYTRGKVAVRINALANAVPRVHRWQPTDLNTIVCHPGAASILHYINCGGLDWFEAKYQIRGSEEANRLWFHVLAQERAKVGRSALRELYDDVLSIPQKDLELQVSEGFATTWSLAEGPQPGLFQEFWGWACIGLGGGLFVHMPLAFTPSSNAWVPRARPTVPVAMSLGQSFEGHLPGESEAAAFCLELPAGERGCLMLDVVLTSQPPFDGGIFLCVSDAAATDTPNFRWVSPMSGADSLGWRCQILPHLLPACATVSVWLGVGIRDDPPIAPCSVDGSVAFQQLLADFGGGAPANHYTAHLHFEPELAKLRPELHLAYSIFHMAYQALDGQALAKTSACRNLELTYAEVEFAPFVELLEQVAQPQPGETFLDLGSGTGRGVLAAAMAFPYLNRCAGYEISEPLHVSAEQASAMCREKCAAAGQAMANVDLRLASFTGEAWEGDIIWVASLCLRPETIADVRQRALALPPGARILTMDPSFGDGVHGFQPIFFNGATKIPVEMSFGRASVFAVRHVNLSDHLTYPPPEMQLKSKNRGCARCGDPRMYVDCYDDPEHPFHNGGYVTDAAICQRTCQSTWYCESFTYFSDSQACWLRGNRAVAKTVAHAMSGARFCGDSPDSQAQATYPADQTSPADQGSISSPADQSLAADQISDVQIRQDFQLKTSQQAELNLVMPVCATVGVKYVDPDHKVLNGGYVDNAQHCQVSCSLLPFCKTFTFYPKTKACWLLGSLASPRNDSAAISGPQACSQWTGRDAEAAQFIKESVMQAAKVSGGALDEIAAAALKAARESTLAPANQVAEAALAFGEAIATLMPDSSISEQAAAAAKAAQSAALGAGMTAAETAELAVQAAAHTAATYAKSAGMGLQEQLSATQDAASKAAAQMGMDSQDQAEAAVAAVAQVAGRAASKAGKPEQEQLREVAAAASATAAALGLDIAPENTGSVPKTNKAIKAAAFATSLPKCALMGVVFTDKDHSDVNGGFPLTANECQTNCHNVWYCEAFSYDVRTKACWLLGSNSVATDAGRDTVSGPGRCGERMVLKFDDQNAKMKTLWVVAKQASRAASKAGKGLAAQFAAAEDAMKMIGTDLPRDDAVQMASIAVAECAAFKQEEAGLAVQDQIDAGSQRAAEAAAEKGMTQQEQWQQAVTSAASLALKRVSLKEKSRLEQDAAVQTAARQAADRSNLPEDVKTAQVAEAVDQANKFVGWMFLEPALAKEVSKQGDVAHIGGAEGAEGQAETNARAAAAQPALREQPVYTFGAPAAKLGSAPADQEGGNAQSSGRLLWYLSIACFVLFAVLLVVIPVADVIKTKRRTKRSEGHHSNRSFTDSESGLLLDSHGIAPGASKQSRPF